MMCCWNLMLIPFKTGPKFPKSTGTCSMGVFFFPLLVSSCSPGHGNWEKLRHQTGPFLQKSDARHGKVSLPRPFPCSARPVEPLPSRESSKFGRHRTLPAVLLSARPLGLLNFLPVQEFLPRRLQVSDPPSKEPFHIFQTSDVAPGTDFSVSGADSGPVPAGKGGAQGWLWCPQPQGRRGSGGPDEDFQPSLLPRCHIPVVDPPFFF